jgi:hypothetical protein
MESALVGVVLLGLARLLAVLLNKPFHFLWSTIAPTDIPYFGTACLSLLLGLGLPYGVNYVLAKRNWTILEAKTEAIERHGNDLLRLLHAASLEEKTVSISLDTGKVYVGLVAATPILHPMTRISGSRLSIADIETKKLIR